MATSRDPFSRLARNANRAALATRRAVASVGASRAGQMARGAASAIKVRTKRVFSAAMEPTSKALERGGVELAGHGTAYMADRVISWRAWGGWLRPSFFIGAAAFIFSALTGGRWSKLGLNLGAGVVHHYAARSFDKINNLLTPGAPSGTEGVEQSSAY